VLTTEANELMRTVHERMPVILQPEHYDVWLDRSMKDTDFLQALLQPFPPEKMTAFEVSKYVNSVRNDGPACIEPLEGAAPGGPPSGGLWGSGDVGG
jgi:putative SOS response-associated peptidase YedK